MSLAARIAATSRRPTATVRLGGKRWADVLTLSREQSYGQGVSGGEVVGRDPPASIVEGETTISWTWGYDGYEVAGFTGIVTRILQRAYPNQWRLQVADPLWLADIRRSDIATDPLNEIAASAAVAQILGAAGLSRLSIPTLPAAGSEWAGAEWVLGTLTPVSWTNATALAAAQAICEVLGYWLYCDASGVVRAALMERRPSSSPFRTLRWGEDFLLASPPERERDASAVRNRVVVRGANTGVQGAQIWDAWETGDADRTQEFSSPLIEYVNESEAGAASCTGVAKRLLALWSRQPNVIRIGRLKADPRAAVGQTWAVECALIGYSSPRAFFLYSLSTTLDLRAGSFAQALVLDGGVGDQGYTTVPPPTASFTWRLVRETLNGVAVVEVFLDGTGSISNTEGEIVSYAWASATAVADGFASTATGPRAMLVYPAATATASITLTVTDTSSKTGAITQVVTLAGDATVTPSSRVISVALGAAWAATPDGGATWNVEASGDATLVPEACGAQLLATAETDATDLRGSFDALDTASTALASLGGTITALSVTDNAAANVWAAVGASLYRSTDGGATFSAWGTLPASIAAVLEDPVVPSSVLVLAGANLYHATAETPGTGWSVLYAGPSGATARHLVRGTSGATTWICYTGTFTGSPLQRVEGPITAAWPLGTSPDVAEVRAIALSTDELTVYAWDAQGRGWSVDSATGVATAITAALGAGETAQHALHDPDDPIVYLATFGASAGPVYKFFPLAPSALSLFYQPASGQQAHRVGLGAGVAVAGRVFVPTYGQSPGGVWEWLDGTWTLRSTGLPAGIYWFQITAHPFDPRHMLLLGNSRASVACDILDGEVTRWDDGGPVLYRSTDGGVSWDAITLTTALSGQINIGETNLAPSRVAPEWLMTGLATGSYDTAIWRIDTAGSSFATVRETDGALFIPGGGQGGEYLLSNIDSDDVRVLSNENTLSIPAGTGVGSNIASMATPAAASRTLIASTGAALYRAADYRAAQPTLLLSGTGGYAAPLDDGTLLVATGGGVSAVPGAFTASAPAASVVALTGTTVKNVRTDAQSRTLAAALTATQIAVRDSGGRWTLADLPAGIAIGNGIEIVGEVAP